MQRTMRSVKSAQLTSLLQERQAVRDENAYVRCCMSKNESVDLLMNRASCSCRLVRRKPCDRTKPHQLTLCKRRLHSPTQSFGYQTNMLWKDMLRLPPLNRCACILTSVCSFIDAHFSLKLVSFILMLAHYCCRVDFIVVLESVVSLVLKAVKRTSSLDISALRGLRVLRPLRAVTYIQQVLQYPTRLR